MRTKNIKLILVVIKCIVTVKTELRKTVSDKILKGRTYGIVLDPKYD